MGRFVEATTGIAGQHNSINGRHSCSYLELARENTLIT